MSDSPQAKRIQFQKSIVAQQVWATCLNCMNWRPNESSAAPPGCGKAANALPPPEVILHGCEAWEGDIPF